MAWMFTVALLAALGAMGAKAVRRRMRRREAASGAGRSAGSPLRIRTFREMDEAVASAHCACGGRLVKLGEGSRTSAEGSFRVARCACASCEEEQDLFFDLAELRH